MDDHVRLQAVNKNLPLFRLDASFESTLPLRMKAALCLRREYSERVTQRRKEEIQRVRTSWKSWLYYDTTERCLDRIGS